MSDLILNNFENNSLVVSNNVMSSVANYITYVNSIPMMTEFEEFDCIERYQNNRDKKAGHKVVLSHLRMVVKIAYQFKNNGVSIMELISEGNFGLFTALDKFDLKKGFRFSTYASWWVKSHIREYITNSWSVVKNSVKGLTSGSADEKYDGKTYAVQDLSIDSDNVIFLSDGDMLHEIDNENKMKKIKNAMEHLSERERYVLEKRVFATEKAKLKDISNDLGLSVERVRQIYESVVDKIRFLI